MSSSNFTWSLLEYFASFLFEWQEECYLMRENNINLSISNKQQNQRITYTHLYMHKHKPAHMYLCECSVILL